MLFVLKQVLFCMDQSYGGVATVGGVNGGSMCLNTFTGKKLTGAEGGDCLQTAGSVSGQSGLDAKVDEIDKRVARVGEQVQMCVSSCKLCDLRITKRTAKALEMIMTTYVSVLQMDLLMQRLGERGEEDFARAGNNTAIHLAWRAPRPNPEQIEKEGEVCGVFYLAAWESAIQLHCLRAITSARVFLRLLAIRVASRDTVQGCAPMPSSQTRLSRYGDSIITFRACALRRQGAVLSQYIDILLLVWLIYLRNMV